jgi:hypothetical protein
MVGEYMQAVDEMGLTSQTIFVVSSDHGDMQMEHMQYYKMVAYEASTRVPLVIAGPGVGHHEVHSLTSLVDLLPTFVELAGAAVPPRSTGRFDRNAEAVDGYSLLPLLRDGDDAAASHPDHVISQFHGETLSMSWYMIRRGEMKYVAWGTGQEHEPQLFNLTADPEEWANLANPRSYGPGLSERHRRQHNLAVASRMDALLRKSIDYPAVTREVAQYNLDMARWWIRSEPHWRGVLSGTHPASRPQPLADRVNATLNWDWGKLWQEHPDWYFDTWQRWVAGEESLVPQCPSALVHKWQSPAGTPMLV